MTHSKLCYLTLTRTHSKLCYLTLGFTCDRGQPALTLNALIQLHTGLFEGYTITPYIESVGASQVFMHCSNEARRDIQALQDRGHLAHLRVQDALHRYESNWQVEWYSEDTAQAIQTIPEADAHEIDRLVGLDKRVDVVWQDARERYAWCYLPDSTPAVTPQIDFLPV